MNTDCVESLTTFIVPDDSGSYPTKTYIIHSFSTEAEMELKFDFYELGTWDGTSTHKGPDSLEVEINDETIDLGTYDMNNDDDGDPETTQHGFTVTRHSDHIADLCSGSHHDQIHHFSIKFPGTKLESSDGEITVTFKPDLKSGAHGYTDVAGFDNIKIIMNDFDDDGDGVSDLVDDKCLDTPEGETVELISPKKDIGCSAAQIFERDCPTDMDTHEYIYCVMKKAKKLMSRELMDKSLQDDLLDDMC